MQDHVLTFQESHGKGKELLGGKGANLAEMVHIGLPVPPGFTITTKLCMDYLDHGHPSVFMDGLMALVTEKMEGLEKHFGFMPLVSVRSGARVSMPGMMDTILNVGITTGTIDEWSERLGSRAALDSYRRLIQMLAEVAMGVKAELFEQSLATIKAKEGVKQDCDLSEDGLVWLIDAYKKIVEVEAAQKFPNTLADQLRMAVRAVFTSWNNDRAVAYRKMHGYSDDWGTAVNIQSMVFGNLNDKSATGVMFTRCPSTGVNEIVGEFLINAQGEDVVAGIRTPKPLEEMKKWNSKVFKKITVLCTLLEEHYKDMQDIEFTIQGGELYVLQTRNGKRSAAASFKIAHDLWSEGQITASEVVARVNAKDYFFLDQPAIDPTFNTPPDLEGIPAGGPLVSGVAVFSSDAAINCKEPCILVATETTPNDIEGMNASVGILTSTGGTTSHAAVVARGMNKTCVVGVTEMEVSEGIAYWVGEDANYHFKAGDLITLDGNTGRVWISTEVPVIQGEISDEAKVLLEMAMGDKEFLPSGRKPEDAHNGQLFVRSMILEGWTSADTKQVMLDYLRGMTKAGVKVYLDMTSKKSGMAPEDKAIEFIFSDGIPEELMIETKVRLLQNHANEFSKSVVIIINGEIDPVDAKLFKKLGYALVSKPKTLKDILSSGGMIINSPEMVSSIFGDEETYQQMIKLMGQGGVAVKSLPTIMPKSQAVFEALG